MRSFTFYHITLFTALQTNIYYATKIDTHIYSVRDECIHVLNIKLLTV